MRIFVDGVLVPAFEGESVAAALLAAGIRTCRKTAESGNSRGYFCGMGACFDCSMIVDGVSYVRTCVTRVRDGMRIEVQMGCGRLEGLE